MPGVKSELKARSNRQTRGSWYLWVGTNKKADQISESGPRENLAACMRQKSWGPRLFLVSCAPWWQAKAETILSRKACQIVACKIPTNGQVVSYSHYTSIIWFTLHSFWQHRPLFWDYFSLYIYILENYLTTGFSDGILIHDFSWMAIFLRIKKLTIGIFHNDLKVLFCHLCLPLLQLRIPLLLVILSSGCIKYYSFVFYSFTLICLNLDLFLSIMCMICYKLWIW